MYKLFFVTHEIQVIAFNTLEAARAVADRLSGPTRRYLIVCDTAYGGRAGEIVVNDGC